MPKRKKARKTKKLDPSFDCPQCGAENFKTARSFLSHLKKYHANTMQTTIRMLEKEGKLDPETKVRKKLITVPRVVNFRDFQAGEGKIRVLHRANSTLFPELMLAVKFRGMKHEVQDDMLKDAGFTEESRGKWVLRTNKYSIFLYV